MGQPISTYEFHKEFYRNISSKFSKYNVIFLETKLLYKVSLIVFIKDRTLLARALKNYLIPVDKTRARGTHNVAQNLK